MRLHALILTGLLLLVASAASRADSVSVAGRRVDLPIPRGFCVLKDEGPEGEVLARMRAGVGTNGKILVGIADCKELATMRAAPPGAAADGFDDFGGYTVLVRDGEIKLFDGHDRDEYIRMMSKAASNGQLMSGALQRAEERIRHLTEVKQLENLGVLAADANAFYFGVTALQPSTGEHLLGIGGSTLVKSTSLTLTLYRTLKKPADLDDLLALQKANLAALVAANR